MKIIILDTSGLAGREAALAAVRRGHKVVAVGAQSAGIPEAARHVRMDVSATASLERLLLDEFPDAVVNTAALGTPDACAQDPTLATALNITLPLTLARMAHHLSARLIHLSTDLVFDGRPPHLPYAHTATPAPTHLCGHTRLEGEKAILRHAKNFATALRVPPLLGNSPANGAGQSPDPTWHEHLLATWATNTPTPLPRAKLRQYLSADNLADVIVELCERPPLTGIYHWAGTDALSPWDAARRLARHFNIPPALAEKLVPDPEPKDATQCPNATSVEKKPPHPATTPILDLRLDLHPLRGKLKTPAENFDTILARLAPPPPLRPWLASLSGKTLPLPRLVKGVDF
ncbi:MAG: sugar nucleotide-binding protein [Puniceicoccales bacterium]|jgi:dTDP-4-dehydrorhamnose reductase|nr:sugar nucleotide-binding protein [Puniceicoccales bacterium]